MDVDNGSVAFNGKDAVAIIRVEGRLYEAPLRPLGQEPIEGQEVPIGTCRIKGLAGDNAGKTANYWVDAVGIRPVVAATGPRRGLVAGNDRSTLAAIVEAVVRQRKAAATAAAAQAPAK